MSEGNETPDLASVPGVLTNLEARIHCPKCKQTNPTDAELCEQCGQALLPGRGVGLRLFFFLLFLALAGVFLYLMYSNFIRESAPNPDSFWLNPVSLSVGILLSLILAFVLALRRIPVYKRYENRSNRHLNLNIRQSIADLTSALELAPQSAQLNLLKQRRRLYEKIGDSINADRDRLALALHPDAWKSEGDFLSVFGDMDGGAFSWSMRRGAIDNLVSSGVAVAVGFCPECKAVVELNKDKKCPLHPKVKGRDEELVIPADVTAGRLKVMSKLAKKVPSLGKEIIKMVEAKEAVALAYCPQCQRSMELDAQQNCPQHPHARLKDVIFVVPNNVAGVKRQMLLEQHLKEVNSTRNLAVLVSIVFVLVITYFVFLK